MRFINSQLEERLTQCTDVSTSQSNPTISLLGDIDDRRVLVEGSHQKLKIAYHSLLNENESSITKLNQLQIQMNRLKLLSNQSINDSGIIILKDALKL